MSERSKRLSLASSRCSLDGPPLRVKSRVTLGGSRASGWHKSANAVDSRRWNCCAKNGKKERRNGRCSEVKWWLRG